MGGELGTVGCIRGRGGVAARSRRGRGDFSLIEKIRVRPRSGQRQDVVVELPDQEPIRLDVALPDHGCLGHFVGTNKNG